MNKLFFDIETLPAEEEKNCEADVEVTRKIYNKMTFSDNSTKDES